MFSAGEIDSSWFTGPLTPTHRRKILPMIALGGGRFSVFAKIEAGKFHHNVFKDILRYIIPTLKINFPTDRMHFKIINFQTD